MSQILIRGLAPEVKIALKQKAAEHNRSMEAEAREILTDYLMPTSNDVILDWIEGGQEFADSGEDLFMPERGKSREVEGF